MTDPLPDRKVAIDFGRFRVLPHRRELLADGLAVELGGRAFDVLMALIDSSGEVISQDALMNRVWASRNIEPNSVQAQISTLRKALGDQRDLIRTVPGRGYQFTGVVVASTAGPAPARHPITTSPLAVTVPTPTNLPESVSELIGRDTELTEVLGLTSTHRLVTLTGTGGIGKTRLGLEVARRLLPNSTDGVWFIELAPLADPDLVPITVAKALGLEASGGAVSSERLAHLLSGKHLTLVLDNCEHVLDMAAVLTEALLRMNSRARVLTTSREPLRVEGEWIYLVPPLAVPEDGATDVDGGSRYGSLRLFVERARAGAPHLPWVNNQDMISAICRRLDGLPLAIELAAARVATLGIEQLASGLDDRMNLLIGGRRTALPRQRTIRATLDWSYELLPDLERCLLRRLGVFAGGFTLEAAIAVMSDTGSRTRWEIAELVSNLVSKSLVTFDRSAPASRWMLLETVRAYALEKLTEYGEIAHTARLHAVFFRDLATTLKLVSTLEVHDERLAACAREIDNIRAALEWAFSSVGDPTIGVSLTAAYLPVWLKHSMLVECRERTDRALSCLQPDDSVESHLRMQLQLAHGTSLIVTFGPVEQSKLVFSAALDLAKRLDDMDAQLRALWGLWTVCLVNGECQVAEVIAEEFLGIASRSGKLAGLSVAHRILGYSLHLRGAHADATRHFERVIGFDAARIREHAEWFLYDQRVLARAMLARALCIQGYLDQAAAAAQASLDEALATGNKLTLCLVLADAVCPVALMIGNVDHAERGLAMLADAAGKHGFRQYVRRAHCLEGMLLIAQSKCATGVRKLEHALQAGQTVNEDHLDRHPDHLEPRLW